MNPPKMLLLIAIFLVYLTSFSMEAVIKRNADIREKRAIPNWSMSASDFYGWVEELRNLAAHDKTDEMAKIYWAHFPIASHLGYDDPDAEE